MPNQNDCKDAHRGAKKFGNSQTPYGQSGTNIWKLAEAKVCFEGQWFCSVGRSHVVLGRGQEDSCFLIPTVQYEKTKWSSLCCIECLKDDWQNENTRNKPIEESVSTKCSGQIPRRRILEKVVSQKQLFPHRWNLKEVHSIGSTMKRWNSF